MASPVSRENCKPYANYFGLFMKSGRRGGSFTLRQLHGKKSTRGIPETPIGGSGPHHRRRQKDGFWGRAGNDIIGDHTQMENGTPLDFGGFHAYLGKKRLRSDG